MRKSFHKYTMFFPGTVIALLFATSLWQLAAAGWIQGKAIIAQQLLKHAWQQTVNDSTLDRGNSASTRVPKHKPWPWADSWPVAMLQVPQQNIEQVVLAGDSGSSLAFAPGHAFASAAPNTSGLTMISGHRDTHFSFLKDLEINDLIYLQTVSQNIAYRISDIQIVDSTEFMLPNDSAHPTLVLVTCYPFNAITSGGPLRYLVFAEKSKQ